MSTAKFDTWQKGDGTRTYDPIHTWVNFNGTGTVSIRASRNVSSVTDGGVGIYTINFTTAMANINYSCPYAGGGIAADNVVPSGGRVNPTTTSLEIRYTNTASFVDPPFCYAAIVGGI